MRCACPSAAGAARAADCCRCCLNWTLLRRLGLGSIPNLRAATIGENESEWSESPLSAAASVGLPVLLAGAVATAARADSGAA